MRHVVTKEEAHAVLPLLRAHAATLLETLTRSPEAKLTAMQLRAGDAGGNAIEGTNQNYDHDALEDWPGELDTFWRVLCAFEEVALDGHMQRGGMISALRNAPEQPHPWMLHAAAHAMHHHAQTLIELAETYRAVEQPAYERI